MKKNKALKWEIKDVIAAALLSLFLILIQFIVNMVCMTNHFVSMVLSVGFYHVLMCTCLLSAFVSGKEALCQPCLYEYRRYDLSVDGELVSFTVLCCNWYDMRSNLVERLF